MSNKSILSYDKTEQISYVEKLFLTEDTEKALSEILINENLNLEINNLISNIICKKNIKKHLKKINGIKSNNELNLYIKAMIISILDRLKKNDILSELVKCLGESNIKELYNYNRIDNKYSLKKYINNDIQENKPIKKSKKVLVNILLVLVILLFLSLGIYFWINDIKLLNYYKDKIYPNFYIYDVDISEKEYDDLNNIIDSIKNNMSNKEITFEYNGIKKSYKMSDVGLNIESGNLIDQLSHYSDELNYKEKLNLIKSKKVQQFKLNINYDEQKTNKVVEEIKKAFNKSKKEGYLTRDNNYNVRYIEGNDGFSLDENKLRQDIKNILENPTLSKDQLNIKLSGNLIKQVDNNSNLKLINKKISTYTTTFANYGPRGHNISLAAKKATGTILQPGDVFSYRNIVGPYTYANGYREAPIQQNGGEAYASGGGVCQLATTMFNAQLLAGLQTVYRTNHGAPVAYVSRGMDATVYGDTVDYKFKNNYKYPIYISVYTTSTTLTVDIWSNEKAMDGKTYKPYVVAKNGLEYLTYLQVYKNGKKIETKYIGYSYYLK